MAWRLEQRLGMRSYALALFVLAFCSGLVYANGERASSKPSGHVQAATPVDGVAAILGRPGIEERLIPYSSLRAELQSAAGEMGWKNLNQLTWAPMAMRGKWRGEHLPGWKKGQVVYLAPGEAEAHRVVKAEDGLLYVRGQLLNTARESFFIVDVKGDLYVRDQADLHHERDASGLKFKHSSFFGDTALHMPFEGQVVDGRFVELKNRSGHFHPARRKFVTFVLGLENQGLDLSRAQIAFDHRSPVDDDPSDPDRD
jgi:hypothetical protein